MLFTTWEFAAFLAVLLAVLAFLRGGVARKVALLAGSLVFYGWGDPRRIALLVLTGALHYGVGLALGASSGARRRLLLGAGIGASVALLALFKALDALGVGILPVGISFFTFQAIGYSVDVYRGHAAPARSPLDFGLFVSFFPQLVCGPISRASGLLPQFAQDRRPRLDRVGLALVLSGLVKKVVIADGSAILADAIYGAPESWTTVTLWMAALAYYVQIYCDFSGYTDLARGIGRLLGYDLPENFRRPYFARSPAEFWGRWHVTLTGWFRDYVFFPMGGPYGPAWRWMRNVALTFLLTGLWHGGTPNFLVWGALHGAGLIAYRWWQTWSPSLGITKAATSRAPYRLAAWIAAQLFVLLTWVPFRVTDLDLARRVLGRMLVPDLDFRLANMGLGQASLFSSLALIAAFFALHAWSDRVGGLGLRLAKAPLPLACAVAALAGAVLVLLWPMTEAPFLYFQF